MLLFFWWYNYDIHNRCNLWRWWTIFYNFYIFILNFINILTFSNLPVTIIATEYLIQGYFNNFYSLPKITNLEELNKYITEAYFLKPKAEKNSLDAACAPACTAAPMAACCIRCWAPPSPPCCRLNMGRKWGS